MRTKRKNHQNAMQKLYKWKLCTNTYKNSLLIKQTNKTPTLLKTESIKSIKNFKNWVISSQKSISIRESSIH